MDSLLIANRAASSGRNLARLGLHTRPLPCCLPERSRSRTPRHSFQTPYLPAGLIWICGAYCPRLNNWTISSTTNRSDKRQALVRRLLADNENYAQNWISYWNDLLRNDEGVNYAGDRKSITPWLLDSLRNNLPYDQFVSKLLNPVKPSDPAGFLVGVNWRGDISASQSRPLQAAQNSAQVFLGINLKCNSCHDSFISRWKLRDAYGLAAYFTPDDKLELFRCDKATGESATASFLYPQLNRQSADNSEAGRHALAAKLFTEPENGRTPRTLVNRIWARLIGRGIVEPVDDMDAEPFDPALLDWLASDFVAHDYDIKHLIETIMLSRAYQLPAVARESKEVKEYVFAGPEVRRMTAEEFSDSLRSITGEWRALASRGGAHSHLDARLANRRESVERRAGPPDSRSGLHRTQY